MYAHVCLCAYEIYWWNDTDLYNSPHSWRLLHALHPWVVVWSIGQSIWNGHAMHHPDIPSGHAGRKAWAVSHLEMFRACPKAGQTQEFKPSPQLSTTLKGPPRFKSSLRGLWKSPPRFHDGQGPTGPSSASFLFLPQRWFQKYSLMNRQQTSVHLRVCFQGKLRQGRWPIPTIIFTF